MDSLGGILLILIGGLIALATFGHIADALGHPLLVVALLTAAGPALGLLVVNRGGGPLGEQLGVPGRGLAALGAIGLALSVVVYGVLVVKPRAERPEVLRAAMQLAFTQGNLSALGGCWRDSGPWSDSQGYREFCFSGRSNVIFAENVSWNTGMINQCIERPGARLAAWSGTTITLDLPQTSGAPCVNERGRTDFVRVSYVCRMPPGDQARLACDRTIYQWNAPEAAHAMDNNRIFVRTSLPRPLVAAPAPSPAPVAPAPPYVPVAPPPPAPLSRVGPSFDCAAPAVATDPVAQVICADAGLSRLDLAFVQAFQAALHNAGPSGAGELRIAATQHRLDVLHVCGLPRRGALEPGAAQRAAPCLRARYESQRNVWLNYLRSNADAQEEANRPLERHIALQRALRTLGHLPADAFIDGVYGPATRSAIASWQQAERLNASGFLSDFQANRLERMASGRGR